MGYLRHMLIALMVTALSLEQFVRKKMYRMSLRELTDVPKNIPADSTEVYLDLNFITQIKLNAFSHLKACIGLNLTWNEIDRIETGAFNGMRRIQQLILNDNKLENLTRGLLQGLNSVRVLRICCNRITIIEDEIVSNLHFLVVLDLRQNQLKKIGTKTFSGTGNRFILHLEGNKIKTLSPDMFSDIPRPLTLTLGKMFEAYYDSEDDHLTCDSRLCWLKEEERDRTIKWGVVNVQRPRCENNIDWDTWQCNSTTGTENTLTEETTTTELATTEATTVEMTTEEDTDDCDCYYGLEMYMENVGNGNSRLKGIGRSWNRVLLVFILTLVMMM